VQWRRPPIPTSLHEADGTKAAGPQPERRSDMTRIIATALAILASGAALASGADTTLDTDTRAAITEKLTAQGYEVRKIEVEDGIYEAYALKDTNRYEIYLDRDLDVVKSEMDD